MARSGPRCDLTLRFDYGELIPWVKRTSEGALLAISGPDQVALYTPVALRGEGMTTVAEFTVSVGHTVPFVMMYAPSHLAVPNPSTRSTPCAARGNSGLDWACAHVKDGMPEEHWRAVTRSLITLKAQPPDYWLRKSLFWEFCKPFNQQQNICFPNNCQMNAYNRIIRFLSGTWPLAAVIATILLAVAVSFYYLSSGRFIVFQNLFYFPITISCIYYFKKGFVYSVRARIILFVSHYRLCGGL